MGKDSKLNKIQGYFDTKGKRLSANDKDLICGILDNKEKYNNYSRVFDTKDSGRDYKGTWSTHTVEKYQIQVDDKKLHVNYSSDHTCDDDSRTNHFETDYLDIRSVLNALKRIFELQ